MRRATSGNRGTTAVNNSSKIPSPQYLDIAEIKELIELISEKQFNEFELQCGDFRLRLQKTGNEVIADSIRQPALAPSLGVEEAAHQAMPAVVPKSVAPQVPASTTEEEILHIVPSPIVGTFYRAASPTSEPFVKIGDHVEVGKTLCIIEAMKLMNEIHSEASGTISKVYVENGQPVEYGQPLFGIRVGG